MNTEIVTTKPAPMANPFARERTPSHVSAGAVAIEQERAIAEAQGKLVIAKRFPRDEAVAYQRLMEACSRPGLAEEAVYSFPRGGQTVSGPSIRLAEELARCWGNIDYGLRELSRRDGESEMEAYAWDLETNTMSSQKFTVKHIRDRNSSKGGNQVLTDERDIYEIGANMGARRLRARILAVIPGDLADAAVTQCRKTMAGNVDMQLSDRIRVMADKFAKIGVKPQMLEKRMGKKLDDFLQEEVADMSGIYKSVRDGITKASYWFGDAPKGAAQSAVASAINAGAQQQNAPADDLPEQRG